MYQAMHGRARMPTLPVATHTASRFVRRARLDQAVQRLTRIVSVYESEQSRPSPRTVEKVLFNRDRSQEEGDDTQLAADTAEAAATRKRLARELCGGPGLPTTAGVL